MIQFQLRSRSARRPQPLDVPQISQGSRGPYWTLAASLLVVGLLLVSTAVQAENGPNAAPVDLNRATAEQLAGLPGIGATKAAAIVAHRSTSGAFAAVEDLEAVRGIGPALVAKLRPLVTLGSPVGSKTGKPKRSASAK